MSGDPARSDGGAGTTAGSERLLTDPWRRSRVTTGVAFVVVLALSHGGLELVQVAYFDWLAGSEPVSIGGALAEVASGMTGGLEWRTVLLGMLVGCFAPVRDPRRATEASRLTGIGVWVGVAVLVTAFTGFGLLLASLGVVGPDGATVDPPVSALVFGVVTGGIAGIVVAVSGTFVGWLRSGPERYAPTERSAVGTRDFGPAAFGAGLLVAMGVAGGAFFAGWVGSMLGLGLARGLPTLESAVLDWQAPYFEETTGAILVGLVAGIAFDRGRRWRSVLGATAGYAALVGGVVGLVILAPVAYDSADQFAVSLGDVAAKAAGVLVVVGIAAAMTGRLLSLIAADAPNPGGESTLDVLLDDRSPAYSVWETLALFCGLFLIGGAAVGLFDAVRFIGTQSPADLLVVAGTTFRFTAAGLAAVIAIAYPLVGPRTSIRRIGITATVGTTTGYLFVAELWLLAFALTGPTDFETVLSTVVDFLTPAIGVAIVGGVLATLTPLVLRRGDPTPVETPE